MKKGDSCCSQTDYVLKYSTRKIGIKQLEDIIELELIMDEVKIGDIFYPLYNNTTSLIINRVKYKDAYILKLDKIIINGGLHYFKDEECYHIYQNYEVMKFPRKDWYKLIRRYNESR